MEPRIERQCTKVNLQLSRIRALCMFIQNLENDQIFIHAEVHKAWFSCQLFQSWHIGRFQSKITKLTLLILILIL